MQRRQSALMIAVVFLFLALYFDASALANTKDGQQPPPSAGLSHVRVVRLSFMEGTVTVRRPGSTEWAAALVNTPIQEGFSVATDKKSFAEVQFEDGSTVWLGELSSVDFTQLALSAQGGHINHLTLDEGYATLRVNPRRYDDYLLNASGVSLAAQGKTEFRADLNQDRMRVEVFSGHVRATDSNQTETLAKNHSLFRDIAPAATFQVADNIQKDDWDKWTNAREQQSTRAYNNEAVSPANPLYGWDDLDVYGDWSYFPGYGNAWAPYEPLGWSPYSAGMWESYPGMGYTWISQEPWGWLPFHYGFWNFNAGMGWFWMPGSFGAWNPALVNWYAGSGWIGWSPIGAAGIGGRAPCTLAVAGCLTAVPPNTLGNGEPIRPGSPHVIHPSPTEAITAIARPEVAPNRSSTLSRQSSPRVVPFSSARNGQQSENNSARAPKSTLFASGFTRGREAAPSSIVMGRQVSPETFVGHHSSLGSAFGSKYPIRVRLGGTMGGKFPTSTADGVGGRPMTVGGEAYSAQRARSMTGGPQILTRSSNGDFSPAGGGFASRGIAPSGMAQSGASSPGISSGNTGGVSRGGGPSSSGNSGTGGGHR